MFSKRLFGLLILSVMLMSQSAVAHHLYLSETVIRAPIPGMKNTAGFFTIENTSNMDEVLVSARSTSAKKIEFHDHIMSDGQMKMVKLDQILLPKNNHVKFQSGGLHLMVFGLKPNIGKTMNIEFETESGLIFSIEFNVTSILDQHRH